MSRGSAQRSRVLARERSRDLAWDQWRASRGPKYGRVAWGPNEAAAIADIPTRTLQSYRNNHLVEPTVLMPALGVHKPGWGAADVLRARTIWDLSDLGVPHHVVRLAAEDLKRAFVDYPFREQEKDPEYEPDPRIPLVPCPDLKKLAEMGVVVMLPAVDELIDEMVETFAKQGPPVTDEDRAFCVLAFFDEEDEKSAECLADLQELADEEIVLLYPLGAVAGELAASIDAWFGPLPRSSRTRPPWLG